MDETLDVAVYEVGTRSLLRRSAGFRRVWIAHTTSVFGDAVTLVALPTTAVLTVHAGSLAVAAIFALEGFAWVLFALFAGVWIDRMRRRRVMIACDISRIALIASLPAAYALGVLTLWQVLVVAAVTSIASVFFVLASSAYLPEVLPPDDLSEANGRLELSTSVSQLTGPGLAGVLVGSIGAPLAMLVDAGSFLSSAAFLRSSPDGPAPRETPATRFRARLFEGFAAIRQRPELVWAGAAAGVSNFGLAASQAVLFLFIYRGLHLRPFEAGIALSVGAAGSVVGAAVAPRVARRIGAGRTLLIGTTGEGLGLLVAGLALVGWPTLWLGLGLAARGFFGPLWNVTIVTIRQIIVPPELLARVTAGLRLIGVTPWPVGAVAAGVGGAALAGRFGPEVGFAITLALACLIGATSGLLVLPRCLRTLRLPDASGAD